MPDSSAPAPIPPRLEERLHQLLPLLDELRRATSPDRGADAEAMPARVVLDVYVRAVRGLREVALEARGRVERTATVVTEAQESARRRRRRANKAAARVRTKTREGSR